MNLHRELTLTATAVLFLTRLPVGRWASGDPAALAAASRYFPLVGALLALLQTLVWLLAISLLPALVAVLLVVIAGVVLTGALHEDGLADVADSAGAFERARKLEIMRDSRLGTYGVVALILLFALRVTALWQLTLVAGLPQAPLVLDAGVASAGNPDSGAGSAGFMLAALVAAHALARWSSLWLMATQPYVRSGAANQQVADGVTGSHLVVGTLFVLSLLLPAAGWLHWSWLLLLPLGLAASWLAGRLFQCCYGGITGDCLGAANQLVEIVVLIAIGAALS